MNRLGLAVAFVLLGGCVEPEAAPNAGEDEPAPAEAQLGSSALTTYAPSNSTDTGPVGTGFAVDVDGAGGDWIVIFHPMDTSGEIRIAYELDVRTTGPGEHAFWVPPVFARGSSTAWDIPRLWPFEHEVLGPAEDLHVDRRGTIGTSGDVAGVLLAFASDAPWTLSLRWDGGGGDPGWSAAGSGATFSWGSVEIPLVGVGHPGQGAVTGHAVYEGATMEPGWTHIELVDWIIEPVEVRQYAWSLANAYEGDGLGYMYGTNGPTGGTAASSARVSYVGSLLNTAGPNSLEATYAAVEGAVEVRAVHVPSPSPPGLGLGDYVGATWPFDDIPV